MFYSLLIFTPPAYAVKEGGYHYRPPYGDFCPKKGFYGERRPVRNPEEALRLVRDYFSGDIELRLIGERRWFFVIEVRRKGELLDIVILDKRTGRMRSIF